MPSSPSSDSHRPGNATRAEAPIAHDLERLQELHDRLHAHGTSALVIVPRAMEVHFPEPSPDVGSSTIPDV